MKYFILILLVSSSFLVDAQNLIENGGFEERNPIHTSNLPRASFQIYATKKWEDEFWGYYLLAYTHTPDWISSIPTKFHHTANGQIVQANTGEYFAGMTVAEMIQQKLDDPLDPDKSYKLSFYVKLAPTRRPISLLPTAIYSNARINVLLADKKMQYENYSNNHGYSLCLVDWELFPEKKASHVIAADIPVNLEAYPDGWHKVEAFLERGNFQDDLDWIGFEFLSDRIEPTESTCHVPYIYLYDIELVETTCDECRNCSYRDRCIVVDIANNQNNPQNFCPTFINFENVTYVRVKIYNSAGQLVEDFDLNNPPDQFSWEGGLPGAAYEVNIIAYNDCHSIDIWKRLDVPEGSPCQSLGEPIEDGEVPPSGQCCGEDLYLNNVILNQDFVYRANRIFVGPNVLIESGTIIEFHAQTEIDISSFVEVEQGADWFAYIDEECIEDFGDPGISSGKITLTNINEEEVAIEKLQKSNETLEEEVDENEISPINVFPNPSSNGIINIDLGEDYLERSFIQVYGVTGKLITTRISISNQTTLDLSNQAKGVYFLRIRQGNKVFTKKVIIQ